jgi:hypothetical protein
MGTKSEVILTLYSFLMGTIFGLLIILWPVMNLGQRITGTSLLLLYTILVIRKYYFKSQQKMLLV